MNEITYRRVLKFCLVGGIGIGVQLGVLDVLQLSKVDYLIATGLAVESAVVHNFLWHWHFTWADRARCGLNEFLFSLARFHLSNGLISIFGNLALMRVLVGKLELPVLPANISAIAICFVANFLASDYWVFRVDREANHAPRWS
jgi:putative flippase GtrA